MKILWVALFVCLLALGVIALGIGITIGVRG